MSQERRDDVIEVLNEADASSDSLVPASERGGGDGSARTDLLETAERASELLESTDPDELLEAVGLDALPDGSEPDSIPAAIAQGDPEQVEELQRLLSLARLADRDDDALEGAVDELAASVEDGDDEADAEQADEGGDADDAAGDDEGTAEDDEDATDDLGDQLRSAMTSTFEGVGDDLEGLQGRLEEASRAVTDGEADEDGDGETTDGEDTDGDGDEEDAEDDEEGLVESGLESIQDRGASSDSSGRYSTMAPPPSERADMKAVVRHSTMPDRN